MGGIAIKSW